MLSTRLPHACACHVNPSLAAAGAVRGAARSAMDPLAFPLGSATLTLKRSA